MNQKNQVNDNRTVTFVTSLIDIYDKPINGRSLDWRFEHFEKLVCTSIPICLFISQKYYDYFNKRLIHLNQNYNLFIHIFDFNNSHIYNIVNNCHELSLPLNRNQEKDTKEYMILMNQKIEQIKLCIDMNPFNTHYFAWIDFSINYIFKDSINTLHYLSNLSHKNFSREFISIPGCWMKDFNLHYLYDNIHWRFCGGFFIGDKNTLLTFYNFYLLYFPEFISKYKRLVWEVNFWTWLESEKQFKFNWFSADHNDSMCILPPDDI